MHTHNSFNSFKLPIIVIFQEDLKCSSKATTMLPKCRYFKGGKPPKLAVRQMTATTTKTYCASWWTFIEIIETWTSSAFSSHATLIIVWSFLFLLLFTEFHELPTSGVFRGIKKKSMESLLSPCEQGVAKCPWNGPIWCVHLELVSDEILE